MKSVKNMTVLEYGDDIIIIDCGLAFLRMICWGSIWLSLT